MSVPLACPGFGIPGVAGDQGSGVVNTNGVGLGTGAGVRTGVADGDGAIDADGEGDGVGVVDAQPELIGTSILPPHATVDANDPSVGVPR